MATQASRPRGSRTQKDSRSSAVCEGAMHGRKRESAEQTAERKAASSQKAALYGKLQAGVLARRAAGAHDEATLELSAKLLELNPEVLTAWNLRRDALDALLPAAQPERAAELLAEELRVTERALRRNPKSYGAWHHRKWALREQGPARADLPRELALCAQLLAADERNFHCWNFRRYVAHLAGASPSTELAFASAKIDANFSNYSAWHYRSALLPSSLAGSAADDTDEAAAAARFAGPFFAPPPAAGEGDAAALLPPAALAAEFELVASAFYTEPDDTAAWVYHDWLLGKALQAAGAAATADAWRQAGRTVAEQAALMRELLGLEPGARWPSLALARLLRDAADCARRAGDGDGEPGWREEAAQLLQSLIKSDPMRRGYYRDCIKQLQEDNA